MLCLMGTVRVGMLYIVIHISPFLSPLSLSLSFSHVRRRPRCLESRNLILIMVSFFSTPFRNPKDKPLPKNPVRANVSTVRTDSDEASPLSGHSTTGVRPSVLGDGSAAANSRPGTVRRWTTEIIACGGAILALVAVGIFLSQYDGRPRPQWPYTITINTVVSIFGLMLKACMLVPVAEGMACSCITTRFDLQAFHRY